jgi:putative methionine-R-sulfoxide reductase with GAF domain/HAMP domain-containing protein
VKTDSLDDQLENLFSGLVVPDPGAAEAAHPADLDDKVGSPLQSFPADDQPSVQADADEPDAVAAAVATEASPPQPVPTAVPGERRVSGLFGKIALAWRSRLGRRLVMALLAAAIIPSLMISVFGIISQATQARRNVTDSLRLLAALQENQIEQWIQAQKVAFIAMAHEPAFVRQSRSFLVTQQTEDEAQATELSIGSQLGTFLVQHPEFLEVYLLDRDGVVLFSTDSLHVGQSENDAPHFVQGQDDSYYKPPAFIESLGRQSAILAEPVRFITGDTIAVLVGHLSAEPLTEIMKSAPTLGDTSEIYLIDSEGRLIAAPQGNGQLRPNDRIRSPAVDSVLDGQGAQGVYENYAGRPVLGAYRWLFGAQMGLLAEQEVTEAFGSTLATIAGTLIVAIAAVGLTMLLSNQMAQRIARPIVTITEAAQHMMAGDLNQSVDIDRADELGMLGQAFNHMARQLQVTITTLEQTVTDRTRQLRQATSRFRKRATHLETSAEISRAAASILDPLELMQTTVDLIRARFGFYHVSIFVLDDGGEWAIVRASTGEVGRQMVTQPHRLRVGGESMVGWVCAKREPRVALDVGSDAIHFDHPLLPETRSELVMPLVAGQRILGALDVQSSEEAAFDQDDVRTLQGMADLIAIALQNARLFVQTRRIVEHQEITAVVSQRLQRAQNTEEILASTLEELAGRFNVSHAAIYLAPNTDGEAGGNNGDPVRFDDALAKGVRE